METKAFAAKVFRDMLREQEGKKSISSLRRGSLYECPS